MQVLLGAYPQARAALRMAVTGLGQQKPLNLIEFPRALNNLAIVELAADERQKAEELGKRCLGLYQEFRLPEDLLRTTSGTSCWTPSGPSARRCPLPRVWGDAAVMSG